MSFSNLLKNAQATNAKAQTLMASPAPASVMTLSLENEPIETLIEAYSGDEYIRLDGYDWYEDFEDNNYSTVDKNKNITVDPSQVNITQETNSQFIPFKISRYWDGIDLINMRLWIHYVNSVVDELIQPVNVQYNSEFITFGWLVEGNATQIAGALEFEIIADGTIKSSSNVEKQYTWRTKPNGKLNIIEALKCRGEHIDTTLEDWTTTVLNPMSTMLLNAQKAAEEAKQSAIDAEDAAKNVNEIIINDAVNKAIEQADTKYATIGNFNTLSNTVDLKADKSTVDTLNDTVNTKANQSDLNTTNANLSNLQGKVGTLPEGITSTNVVGYVQEVLLKYYTKEQVDKLFEDFDISDQLEGIEGRVKTLEDDFASFDGLAALSISYDEATNTLSFFNGETKIKDIVLDVTSDIATALVPINTSLANKANSSDLATVKSTADTNKTDIGTLSQTVASLSEEVSNIDKTPVGVYDISYEENKLSLLYGEDENTLVPKTTVTITGGGGGTGTSSSLKIEYVTKTPLVVTVDDKALIKFKFSGTDSSGDAVLEGQATWKVAGSVVATSVVVDGENEFDITNYLTIGSQKVQLIVTDDAGSLVTKSWTVQKIDVRLESSFNDTFTYPLGTISFAYTPYGAIEKDVHFILDGKEIGTVTTSASGIPMSYTLPSQSHGAHLLEVYMTAFVNNNTIESNHILKDILWYDSESNIPVIGCIQQEFTATQYATTNIVYTVHDPNTETPEVVIAVDGNVVSTKTLEKNTDIYPFRSDDIGDHVVTITCGETVKTINVTITKLDIVIEPVTAGLVFDFNPVGKSNNSADRLWTYSGDNGNYAMTVSDNFDWVNGGYQLNEKGEQYFCIKAGTRATIDYKMFADDAKKTGKECKLVFKTVNVQEANAQFMSCIDNTTGSDHIGIEMFVHEAHIYGSAGKLDLPYAENEIIEFEFNINTNTDKVPEICGYEDGVPTRHLVYDDSFNFTQTNPKVIILGSDKCDLHIYRFKTYNTALNAKGVLNNFIADARSADEMINRYNRNQIYNENNELTPEILAEKCPWLRVYKVSSPYFTNKKSDKVPYTTIQQIYKNGDPVLDNWTCYDCSHSGQGTSSDNYGASARNLDFIMNKSQIEGVTPYFILGDGKTRETKISLTRTSIPVAYLNFKANVASSNHFTNALLAKRYNEFNPYILPYVRENESIIDYIKTTMEFYNAVVFIQESDTATDASGNYTTHREFNDTGWHFYSIGNIGDSKKTDKTRLVDPTDRYECVNEICDVDLPLSEWDNTPEAIAALEAEKFDKSGSYEWRYIWEDGSDEENAEVREYCKQKWIEMYKFVVQSSDEEFKANFEKYFVKDSMLYYYLFTTRYCMVDNRAKNSFWHYAKTGEVDLEGNPIRKWNLTMMYDCDSSMSLNNYGASVYRHGYEDTDVMDGTTEEVFRESKSTIFCRIRDLFADDLKDLYNTLESKNAWNAESFLSEIEAWQNEFPEELWRLDAERKYLRTYNESFINGAGDPQYLKNMAQGKMKYRVKQWERGQEAYMASKYQSSTAASDNIVLRCTVPEGNLVVPTNYKLKLTPYDYMYLNVKYGTQEPIQVRSVPGVQYEIPFEGESVDIIDIFSASRIQDLGDLSTTYPATVDTSKATRLKELHIGNSTEGYDNPSLTTMTLGANYLLEVLNVENVSGLTQSLNLSALNNLRELYAHGTNASGVTFANGGEIEIAELPAITAMAMRNLLYLTNLDITSLDKLTSLTVESCNTVDVKAMFENAPNLNRVRITGIDWVLTDTALLERIYNMSGLDKNGYNTERAVLAGTVHVPVIRQQQLADYNDAWSDLEITYDTMIEQFAVTFVNDDGTVLEVQYVDKGESAIDPTTRIENRLIPTKASDEQYDYTFDRWDNVLTNVFSDRIVKATYSSTIRKYTIEYVSKGTTVKTFSNVDYGTIVVYDEIPKYTAEEGAYAYYIFDRWDQSGYVNGNKTINAIYDKCQYVDGYFDGLELSDMRPVEIYALTKLSKLPNAPIKVTDVLTEQDEYSFELGHDFNFEDIPSETIINTRTHFNGTNHIDTGIKLFDEDKDFVIAIDYEFLTGCSPDASLAECYLHNGSKGFRLSYSGSAKVIWSGADCNVAGINKREMLILRHVKGETGLHVYNSNLDEINISTEELTRSFTTKCDNTLIFGASCPELGVYENHAVGNIYWCKIWYKDLGHELCKKLAMWTHEKLTMQVCGFNRYYITNQATRCSFSLLATHLLERCKPYNEVTANSGGWAASDLNKFLNNRLYSALPDPIKLLVKQVSVKSSIGDKSLETMTSECYINIPSLLDVDISYKDTSPYNEEVNSKTVISYITDKEVRKRAFDNGETYSYWLRSPNATNNTNTSYYVWYVKADGIVNGLGTPTTENGVVIEMSF